MEVATPPRRVRRRTTKSTQKSKEYVWVYPNTYSPAVFQVVHYDSAYSENFVRQFKDLLHISSKKAWIIEETLGDDVKQAIVQTFSQISQVAFIYHCVIGLEHSIFVYTNNTSYDDELMDELLDRELGLEGQIPRPLAFYYFPLIKSEIPVGMMPKNAECIYPMP